MHLGFAQPQSPSTAALTRGAVVASRPRPWLTVRDVQSAFLAARVRLNDTQAAALGRLVSAFAKAFREAPPHGPEDRQGVLDRSTTSLALTVASAVTASTAKPLTAHSHSHSQSHKNGQAAPALPKAVVAPGQKLSAEWLRLYLAHLRLSQRAAAAASAGGQVGGGRGVPSFPTQSISRSISAKARRSLSSLSLAPSAAAAAAATQKRPAVPKSGGDGDGDLSGLKAAAGGLGDEPSTDSAALALLPAPSTMPMPWLDWLGAPLLHDPRAAAGGKSSRAFKKALAGVPHSLSREDVNRILEGHEIAPAAAVEAEVAHRVRCWVLDTRCAEPFSLPRSYPHAASYLPGPLPWSTL